MNPTTINGLLPEGYFAVFVEAEDESVDSEFAIHNADGETGVAVQIGPGDFCVNKWNEAEQSMRHWSVWQFDQLAGLKKDLTDALAAD